jgi:hypothetical protein
VYTAYLQKYPSQFSWEASADCLSYEAHLFYQDKTIDHPSTDPDCRICGHDNHNIDHPISYPGHHNTDPFDHNQKAAAAALDTSASAALPPSLPAVQPPRYPHQKELTDSHRARMGHLAHTADVLHADHIHFEASDPHCTLGEEAVGNIRC